MRTLFLTFVLFQTLTLSAQKGYSIEVVVDGADNETAYLGYYLGSKTFIKDTVVGVNGRFVFKGDEALGEGLYMYVDPTDLAFSEFIIGKDQQFKISLKKDEETASLTAVGSEENTLLFDYARYMMKQNEKMKALREESTKLAPTTTSFERNSQEIAALEKEIQAYNQNLITAKKDLIFGKMLKMNSAIVFPPALSDPNQNQTERYYYYMKHYFDNVDFSSPAMMRTPAFQSRIDDYFDRLVVQHPDSMKLAVDRLLTLANANDEIFKYVTIETVNKFAKSNNMYSEGVYAHIVDNYYATGKADWVDEEKIAVMKSHVEIIKRSELLTISEQVKGVDHQKKAVSLHEQLGEMLLVFVFDPRSSGIDSKLQQLFPLLKNYTKEQLQLVTISSLGTNEEWKKQLDALNLLQNPQIVNMYSENDAYLFEKKNETMNSVFMVLLLDKDRRIIAKDLTMDSFAEIMNDALGITEE